MATIIRIKRRLAEEPLENIVVRAKRSRVRAEGDEHSEGHGGGEGHGGEACATAVPETTTLLMRVGTLQNKDEDVAPHILRASRDQRKSQQLREAYKRLRPSTPQPRDGHTHRAAARFKIVEAFRSSKDDTDATGKRSADQDNSESENKADKRIRCEDEEKVDIEVNEKFKVYDAEAQDMEKGEDVITCNGVAMGSEKYVYDLYYTPHLVHWQENICEINKHQMELCTGSDSDDGPDGDYDDDENDEDNWRNDYPDESDDSQYSDDIDYLDAHLRKGTTRQFETDESYDLDDYDEDFDEDGSLRTYFDRLRIGREQRAEDIDSDSD